MKYAEPSAFESALVFLYRHVLLSPFEWISDLERAKKSVRLPTVLSRGEVMRVFAQLHGTPKLIASLLYGSGLRLLEACARDQNTLQNSRGVSLRPIARASDRLLGDATGLENGRRRDGRNR
jgi:integrase